MIDAPFDDYDSTATVNKVRGSIVDYCSRPSSLSTEKLRPSTTMQGSL